MNFIPYKVNEVLENFFYQIPKELLINPAYNNLDSNRTLLYGLLLDRLSVSMKNKWIDYRAETIFTILNDEDKKHIIQYDEITERILKNVPMKSKKYVMKQLELLNKNYMDYFDYWCEKHYRAGFADIIELLIF